MPKQSHSDDALLRRWVETWRRAGIDLEQIRNAELQSIDTRAVVRHLFDGFVPTPGAPTSGLIEQQAWFARLRGQSKS